MIGVIGILLLFFFVAAQGATIVGSAWLVLRLLHTSRRGAKMAAVAASYAAWTGFTVTGYAMLGGDGGLMDGFGLVLLLCLTALVSSFIFLVIWVLRGDAETHAM